MAQITEAVAHVIELLAKLQADLEAEIADAQEFGTNSPTPSTDELRRDVFAEEMPA